MSSTADTIVARATPPGTGAIAIIRLSGSLTPRIVEHSFRARKPGMDWSKMSPRRFYLGTWLESSSGRPIDEVQVVTGHAPRTYTGEDTCEIHCHGGMTVVERIVESCCKLHARLAEPGEFTRRAFLNDRMDLTQAEAVCDLITASTEASQRLAFRQLRGKLSEEIHLLRSQVVSIAAEIEARLDFTDEDIDPVDQKRLRDDFQVLRVTINSILKTAARGKVVREGARVVICGRPNTGKSSLLNALAGRERALVTPHPGTTRDTIECTLDIDGYEVTFIDTAGLRDSEHPVEQLGIEATKREIETADLALWLVDATDELTDEDMQIRDILQPISKIMVLNKIDLGTKLEAETAAQRSGERIRCYAISATEKLGLEELEKALLDKVIGQRKGAAPEGALIANMRHIQLLEGVKESLDRAYDAFTQGVSGEFTMVDLNEALNGLSEILGLRVTDDVLDRIFNRFCIGK